MSRKILLGLIVFDIFFVLLHLTLGGQYDLFSLDRERTPAALFSALQFVGSGYALLLLALAERARIQKLIWSSSALLYVLLGLDEISELHENAAYYLVKYFPPFPFLHSGTPMWIIFLSPVIIASFILLVWVVKITLKKSSTSGRLLIGALFLCVISLVLEFVGGAQSLQSILPLFVVIEEASELLAGTFFLFAFASLARYEFTNAFQRK